MKQDNFEKNALDSHSRMNRRQLLKSMAVTGGLAAAHPLLESTSWAMGAGATPELADLPLPLPEETKDASEAEFLAKIKGGKRIDIHHQITTPEYLQAMQKAGIKERGGDESGGSSRGTTPDSVLQITDELGEDGAVFLATGPAGAQPPKPEDLGMLHQASNEGSAKLVAGLPKNRKFGFFATLPLPDVAASLKQLEYAMDTLHADGVGFLTTQGGVYLGATDYDELYAEMNRRSVVAFVHPTKAAYKLPVGPGLCPGASIAENLFATTRVGINLIYNGITTRYPNIKWILAHMGGTLPYVAARLEAQRDLYPEFEKRVPDGYLPSMRTQFYYDATSSMMAPSPAAAVTSFVDPSHILYGSDYPAISKKRVAQEVLSFRKYPEFSGKHLEALERGNAISLFKRFA